ncbi:hypothetical protein [Shewanella sp. YIC-542]|uniref:hypothetical protein n=1 Tax=Shewanella mytili TaxID=3377111 RepID=UPI00398E90B0
MAFVRALIQQWNKAQLGHSLHLSLQNCEQVRLLLGGATPLSTVTNLMAALVYSEGAPDWLTAHKQPETPLENTAVLHCLLVSSRLIFVKATQGEALSQAERLMLSLAKIWVQQHRSDMGQHAVAQVIMHICAQVDGLMLQQRQQHKNMQ